MDTIKESNMQPHDKGRNFSPEKNANVLSRITLWWIFPLVYSGWKKPLSDEDLWELRENERGVALVGNLEDALEKKSKEQEQEISVFKALRKIHTRQVLYSGFLRFIVTVLGLANPLLLNNLIQYFSDVANAEKNPPISVGIGWAFSLLAVPVTYAIIENHYFLQMHRTGMRVRSSLQGIIYDKSLTMSPSARAGSSLGEIVNLMQLDTQRLNDFARFIHVLWSSPLQLIITIFLLFRFIRWSALVGIFLTFVTIPLQGKMVSMLMRLRRKGVGIADERVKLMNEVLQGIKAVKFYGWETPFSKQVEEKRKEEIDVFGKTIWINATMFAIVISIPILIGVITFSFYAGVFKNKLEPATVFTAFTLLNMLRGPVIMLPLVITGFIDARLSIQRIEKFLNMEDTESYSRGSSGESEDVIEERNRKNAFISVQDGTFKWGSPGPPLNEPKKKNERKFRRKKSSGDQETDPAQDRQQDATDNENDSNMDEIDGSNTLENISLTMPDKSLTAIVGRVGSGKSSLISAILGEMQRVSGNVLLKGTVSYVSQTAWIFNDTLRNNILFGKDYDEALYKKAIDISALAHDLDMLPAGDLTAIGEKGINLSGGQKQRVSIARAVYADTDIYIFDDPLSALDAHVSQEVFEKCISNSGVLNDRLRLLVTSQVQVLEDCDSVIYLDQGKILGEGSYRSLVSSDPSFRALVDEKSLKDTQKEESKDESGGRNVNSTSQKSKNGDSVAYTVSGSENNSEKKAGKELIQSEERTTGNVKFGIYVRYAKACGGTIGFALLLLFWVVVVSIGIYSTYWLAYWSDQEAKAEATGIPGRGLTFYIGIYIALGVGYAILVLFRNAIFGVLALQASRSLHENTLKSVLNAPMSWFDTTPIGRILSRFSRDVSSVDTQLPQAFSSMLTLVLQLIGSYILIAIILPPFLAVAAPITFGYYLLQRFFNRTSLEVKRLDNISKSPIYTHFSETLSGLSTLRAYNRQDRSRKENRRMIDINTRAYFTTIATNRWFSLYLELLGATLIFFTALFAVVASGSSSPSELGLSLAYALQVTSILGFTITSITELEANMSSVERMEYYAKNIPQEAASTVDYENLPESDRPGENWPEHGKVEMKDVTLRYREGLELVLKGVNVEIDAGEKVGVIGRTGSGKSTLMVALLRIVELAGGDIEIDGINLQNLGLNHIRSSITIIPQDPVLFSGTIRLNIDPFNIYSDAELWDVLEKSNLKEHVQGNENGLDAIVSEYGENLSAGQRQLICLSRALLRKSKVLILDEASSQLDPETDRLIQITIREHLKDATILTIAHRLFTLADYDKIMVMENGVVVEMGRPSDLLRDKNGKLTGFVEALGESGAKQFREIVRKAEKK